ncbi:hypothetical protein [Salidesulfovibrio onnuriiensis]|uniref:hypothetical protein n=1 Tax=Salidesulfovibrio onnuriiensis TaxID=2583823 RepID=UPI00164FE1AE|nr:hypothetical protein [Salidesulfovibrio onnuriiensis]
MDIETRLAVFAMEHDSAPHARAKNAVPSRKRSHTNKAVAGALSMALAVAATLVSLI